MPHKISKLLSRRQANPLLHSHSNQSSPSVCTIIEIPDLKATDNHELLSVSETSLPSLSVKVPSRFSRVSNFYRKLRFYLWGDILPQNTLAQSFFVQPLTLAYLRLIALFMFASGFGWSLANRYLVEDPEFMTMSSALTTWGLLLGFGYFFSVFCTQDVEDDDMSWKVSYIVGEQAVVFNLLSTIVFYGSVLTDVMNGKELSTDNLAYNICIYGLCPLLVTLEAMWNHLTFYEKHRIFLYFIIMFYLLGDICMGMIEQGSWKIDFDWLAERKYGIKMALIGGLMMEFILANKFYCWKSSRKSNDKPPKGK